MKRLARRLLFRSLEPVLRRLINWIEIGDPWELSGRAVAYHRIATGSRHTFDWYLQGQSDVPVGSVDDVIAWLRTCEYESDKSLFNESDFWQHPRTFERLKRGDCEDYAMWAWRKLNELGLDAQLFVGRYTGSSSGHAWVTYINDGIVYLLDCVVEDDSMLQPLAECKDGFEPWFSVSPTHHSSIHNGYLYHMKEWLNTPRKDRRDTRRSTTNLPRITG